MGKYYLAAHAYLCITPEHAVFLDVKRDEYSSLARHEAMLLATQIRGWPADADLGDPRDAGAFSVLDNLLAAGLLTCDEKTGKDAAPIALQPVCSAIGITNPPGSARIADLLHFWIAHIHTTYMLRRWAFDRVVRHVSSRKKRTHRRSKALDLDAARRLVTLYARWQPLAFSATDACLRNSLTLIEFLARHRMYPNWVFGVRTAPFVAHSWVQHQGVVLNDAAEHVRTYIPIMAI